MREAGGGGGAHAPTSPGVGGVFVCVCVRPLLPSSWGLDTDRQPPCGARHRAGHMPGRAWRGGLVHSGRVAAAWRAPQTRLGIRARPDPGLSRSLLSLRQAQRARARPPAHQSHARCGGQPGQHHTGARAGAGRGGQGRGGGAWGRRGGGKKTRKKNGDGPCCPASTSLSFPLPTPAHTHAPPNAYPHRPLRPPGRRPRGCRPARPPGPRPPGRAAHRVRQGREGEANAREERCERWRAAVRRLSPPVRPAARPTRPRPAPTRGLRCHTWHRPP